MKPYVRERKVCAILEDQDIVKMFCIRSEQAIEELSKNMGNYAAMLPGTFLTTIKTQRNV